MATDRSCPVNSSHPEGTPELTLPVATLILNTVSSLSSHLPALILVSSLLTGFVSSAGEEPSASDLQEEKERIQASLDQLPEAILSGQVHGRIGFYGRPTSAQWIVIDLGSQIVPEEVILFPARLPVDSGGDGSEGFPPELQVEIAEDDSFEDAVRIGRWEESRPGAGLSPPFVRLRISAASGVAGRFLRVRIFGDRPRSSGKGSFYSLGEIVVLSGGRNEALRRPVESSAEVGNAPRWQPGNLTDGYLWCLPGRGRTLAEWNGFHSAIETEAEHRKWVEVVFAAEVPVDEVHLVPAHPRDFADTAGFGFPPRFRVLGYNAEDRETVLFDSGDEPFPNPGAATVMIPAEGRPLKRLRVECLELWQRTGDYLFALAEVQAWSQGENVATGSLVNASDKLEVGLWKLESLTDGNSSRRELLSWNDWMDRWEERLSLEARLPVIDERLALIAAERRRLAVIIGAGLLAAVFAGLTTMLIWQRRRAAVSREELRERIAHDLHDELGASLSHLALESDLARRQLSGDDPVRDRLTGLSETARETLDNMRDVIWLLAPTAESWEGFQRRVEGITERMLEGVEHEFLIEEKAPQGRPEIAWAREWVLFFKEALSNARRHSGASRIDVKLDWKPRELHLSVKDNGCGFDPEDPALSPGLGMKTYRRRASALRGKLAISPNPEEGVTVQLRVPLPGKKS